MNPGQFERLIKRFGKKSSSWYETLNEWTIKSWRLTVNVPRVPPLKKFTMKLPFSER